MSSHIVVLLACIFIVLAQETKPLYILEQSFDGGKTWTRRGSIQAVGINKRLSYVADGPWILPIDQLKSNPSSLYQVRFVDSDNNSIKSSISLCDLINSQFRESFLLHLDQTTQKLISVDYSAAVDPSASSSPFSTPLSSCPFPESIKKGEIKQSVKVGAAMPIQGDTISFTGVKTLEEKKKEEEQQNEPGFFRKYVSAVHFNLTYIR